MTQTEFAQSAGISKATLAGYETGQRKPGAEALAAVLNAGINVHWLLNGQGRPLLPHDGEPLEDPTANEVITLALRIASQWTKSEKMQFAGWLLDEVKRRNRIIALELKNGIDSH
ncbi:helix-turn-helix transcriptional regulator [Acidithiobacillus sp. MC6.1]|nr:helix-turn-helix transcriptional regulator [Acidithiobacillus sp. MC6.1]